MFLSRASAAGTVNTQNMYRTISLCSHNIYQISLYHAGTMASRTMGIHSGPSTNTDTESNIGTDIDIGRSGSSDKWGMTGIEDTELCHPAGLCNIHHCSQLPDHQFCPCCSRRCNHLFFLFHTIAHMSEVLFPAVCRRSRRRELRVKPAQLLVARYIRLVYLFSSVPPFFYFYFTS